MAHCCIGNPCYICFPQYAPPITQTNPYGYQTYIPWQASYWSYYPPIIFSGSDSTELDHENTVIKEKEMKHECLDKLSVCKLCGGDAHLSENNLEGVYQVECLGHTKYRVCCTGPECDTRWKASNAWNVLMR